VTPHNVVKNRTWRNIRVRCHSDQGQEETEAVQQEVKDQRESHHEERQ
jgi:hypothetical protein